MAKPSLINLLSNFIIGLSEGYPDNINSGIISGPLAPIFLGEWQSLQPITVTRYSPCLTTSSGFTVTVGNWDVDTLYNGGIKIAEATLKPLPTTGVTERLVMFNEQLPVLATTKFLVTDTPSSTTP